MIHLCHSETNSSQPPKLEEFGGVNKRGIIGKERQNAEYVDKSKGFFVGGEWG